MAGTDMEGNVGTKEPEIGWMIGFLLSVSFVGILALVPLRKVGQLSPRIVLASYAIQITVTLNCDFAFRPQICSFPCIAAN
jgi:hypothetical protein